MSELNRELMLLRHAKATPWSPGVEDFTRPLSDKGRAHMQALAPWVADHLAPPAAIICSPARRTMETLEGLLDAWPDLDARTRYPEAMYGAGPGWLAAAAEKALERHASVLMVGHNPGFERLALGLMPGHERAQRHRMPTGTLAVFRVTAVLTGTSAESELSHWQRGKHLLAD